MDDQYINSLFDSLSSSSVENDVHKVFSGLQEQGNKVLKEYACGRLLLNLEHEKIKNRWRKVFLWSTFVLLIITVFFAFSMVIFEGFHIWQFSLPTAAFISVASGIVVEIVGLLTIVFTYLFPKYIASSTNFKQ